MARGGADREIYREVGPRIRQARLEKGLTQRELAFLVGVSERSMQMYEAGQIVPFKYMERLARFLDRPTHWFYHGGDLSDSLLERQILDLRRDVDELRSEVEILRGKLSDPVGGHAGC